MRATRIIKLGLTSLVTHPLRSSLAVLGIVLGVASVIAMLAIGAGASEEAQAQIRSLGSTTIRLYSKKPPEDGGGSTNRSRMVIYGIKYDDLRRIDETVPDVAAIVPVREVSTTLWWGEKSAESYALGTMVSWLSAARQSVARGRWLNEVDMVNQLPSAVIGAGLAKKLFQHNDALGTEIRIGTKPYTVVGILAGGGAVGGKIGGANARMADDAVFVPMTTVKERWGDRNVKRSAGSTDIELVEVHEAILEVPAPELVIPTAEAVKALLARFHKKEDYTVVVPLALLEESKRTKRIFNIVLGSIAGISLVVGGIGIMNIMLATVTERTREIGIRRALGARRRDITLQFLAESLTLCLVGGIAGVGLGLLVPVYVEWKFDLPTLVHPDSVALAFGISAATGLLFGIYPAARAAKLDPIEALRHE